MVQIFKTKVGAEGQFFLHRTVYHVTDGRARDATQTKIEERTYIANITKDAVTRGSAWEYVSNGGIKDHIIEWHYFHPY